MENSKELGKQNGASINIGHPEPGRLLLANGGEGSAFPPLPRDFVDLENDRVARELRKDACRIPAGIVFPFLFSLFHY